MNVHLLIRKYNISFAFFLVSVFTLCLSRKLFIISLWPWFFFWILEGDYQKKVNISNYKKGKPAIILIPSIFFLLLISMIWSVNTDYGAKSLGEKFSLILIPFFLVFTRKDYLDPSRFRIIQKVYLSALFISALYLLSVASAKAISFENGQIFFDPVVNKWENVFLYYNFSHIIHPSYYAMIHLMGLAFCLHDLRKNVLFKKRYIPLLLGIFYTAVIVLTSSRSAYIALFIIIIYSLLSFHLKASIKVISIILLFLFSGLYINHTTRFINMIDGYEPNNGSVLEALIKTNIRYEIWNSSFNIIKENPLTGVGIGDSQNRLNQEYKNYGYDKAFKRKLNAHNQFIEIWLSTGITGLLILLLVLALPLFIKDIKYKGLLTHFLIIMTIMFIFESVLNRMWGVAFFSIFYTLLTRRYAPGQEEEPGSGKR